MFTYIPLLILTVHRINRFRQIAIFVRDNIPCIVGGQVNFNRIPLITPTGVMVHFFHDGCHFRHKSERLREILELEYRL